MTSLSIYLVSTMHLKCFCDLLLKTCELMSILTKKNFKNRRKHSLRGNPPTWGTECPKKLRHPLKSKVWLLSTTYPKIKRVPLFSEIFL